MTTAWRILLIDPASTAPFAYLSEPAPLIVWSFGEGSAYHFPTLDEAMERVPDARRGSGPGLFHVIVEEIEVP